MNNREKWTKISLLLTTTLLIFFGLFFLDNGSENTKISDPEFSKNNSNTRTWTRDVQVSKKNLVKVKGEKGFYWLKVDPTHRIRITTLPRGVKFVKENRENILFIYDDSGLEYIDIGDQYIKIKNTSSLTFSSGEKFSFRIKLKWKD